MITGVVAQKYTHQASRYFLPFKLFNSAALRKNAKQYKLIFQNDHIISEKMKEYPPQKYEKTSLFTQHI